MMKAVVPAMTDKVGIITGALGGLGLQMTEAFASAGARVALLDLDEDAAARAAAAAGEGHLGVGADITDADQVSAVFERVAEAFGRVDFLINNAGIRYEVPFLEQDLERWKRTLDVNLTGTFLCAQNAARIMAGQGGGAIVNIASVSGLSAFKGRPAYVTSKAGVMGLTRAIAWEMGPSGIRCNAIAPGIVETPLTSHYFQDPERAALVKANTPLERWGQPEEIAAVAVFLCSDAASFIQGQTLVADGGWLAGKGY